MNFLLYTISSEYLQRSTKVLGFFLSPLPRLLHINRPVVCGKLLVEQNKSLP